MPAYLYYACCHATVCKKNRIGWHFLSEKGNLLSFSQIIILKKFLLPLPAMSEVRKNLKHIRYQYDKGILAENHLDSNPILQFEKWMEEAIQTGMSDPNAMDLCTVSNGRPNSRIV